MIKLTIYEYLNHGKRNIFLAILIAMTGILFTGCFLLLQFQWRQYSCFLNFNNQRGLFYVGGNYDFTSQGGTAFEYFTTQSYLDGKEVQVVILPEWIMKKWNPLLLEGSQIDTSGDGQVLIGGNFSQCGEEISLKCYSNLGEEIYFRVTVKGVLDTKSRIICYGDSYSSSNERYTCYFDYASDNVMIMSYDTAVNLKLGMKSSCRHIVTFDDSIADSDIDSILEQLKRGQDGRALSLDEFMKNSNDTLVKQIISYLPILFSGSILGIIGLIAVVYVNLLKSGYNQSIFYLVGADSWQRFRIASGSVFITAIFSAALVAGAGIIADKQGWLSQTIFYNVPSAVKAMISFYIGYFVLSFLTYHLAWKGISVKQALTENR